MKFNSFTSGKRMVIPKKAEGKQGINVDNTISKYQRLNKARAKKRARANKGRIRDAAYLNPSEFTHFSLENPNMKCGCKKFNHFSVIHRDTTAMYRSLIHGEGPTKDEKENLIETIVQESIKEAEINHARSFSKKKFDPESVRVRYYLQCALTGRMMPVCRVTFCWVIGSSKGTLGKIVKLIKQGQLHAERHRRKEGKNESIKEDRPEYFAVCTFLEALSEDLSSKSPDCRLTELPSGSKVQYYEMFCEEWKSGLETGMYYKSRNGRGEKASEPPSKSLFYSVWRKEFSGLIVPKRHNRFSKCDDCVRAKLSLQQARNNRDWDELREWKTILYAHYRWVVLQRKKFHKHRRKAAENPHL